MRLKPCRLFTLFCLGFFLNLGSAQAAWFNDHHFRGWYFGSGGAGYGYGLGYYPHSSTAIEGYLRGMGAYYDGLGHLRVNNAIAQRHFQIAYRQYLENRKLRAQTYWELKEMRRQALADRHVHLTPDERKQRAKALLPPRLEKTVWDGAKSTLVWPAVLKLPIFADVRKQLDQLFKDRADNPGDAGEGSENQAEILGAIQIMNGLLASQVSTVSNNSWVQGSRFLRSLAYEARFSTFQ